MRALGVDDGVSAQKAADVRPDSQAADFSASRRGERGLRKRPRGNETWRTVIPERQVERTAAMSLIPKPAGVLAKQRSYTVLTMLPVGSCPSSGVVANTKNNRTKGLTFRFVAPIAAPKGTSWFWHGKVQWGRSRHQIRATLPEIARHHVPRTLSCGFGAPAHFRGNSTGIKAAGWRTERPGSNCNARHYDRVCHRTCINQPRGQLR